MGWRDLFNGGSRESAFGRLAAADTRLNDAQGKLTAIQDSIKAKQDKTAELTQQAAAVHATHDDLDQQIETLHSLLG